MDPAGPGHEKRGHPSSPVLGSLAEDPVDHLFEEYFDWAAYSRDEPVEYSASSPPVPDSLMIFSSSLLGHHFSIEQLGTEIIKMRTIDDPAGRSDYSGQTTPELVQGGSTSPSDHSGSSLLVDRSEEAHHRAHFPIATTLREAQAHDDEWTYPQTDPAMVASRRYPPHLNLVGEQPGTAGLPSISQSAGQKRCWSGNAADRRARQLADPVQTADVRKSGACLPCRVTKTRCHENGVCPACRKSFPDHSHLVCIRKTPFTAWPILTRGPDVWSRHAHQEEMLCSCARKHLGQPREISIFLNQDTASPPLLAKVQPYTSSDDPEEAINLNKADFPRENVPSHEMLQCWVQGHIKREQKTDFAHLLPKFLLAYAEGGRHLPKRDLVENVHKLGCFFRIWRTSSFACRDPKNKVANLPLSVQARLRSIARGGVRQLEYHVLKGLDESLSQHTQPQPAEKVAVWASLWQLMLMYRDLLAAYEARIDHVTRHGGPDDQAESSWLMSTFHSSSFTTTTSAPRRVWTSLEWTDTGRAKQEANIRHLGQQLLTARRDFYNALKYTTNENDRRLYVLVIEHEMKKISNTRKRTPKGGTKSGVSNRLSSATVAVS